MEKSKPEPLRCISCNAKLRGKFCHKCGEKVVKPSDFALAGLINQGQYFGLCVGARRLA